MNNLANIQLTWSDFMFLAFALAILYLLLNFLVGLLPKIHLFGRFQPILKTGIEHVIVLFEPIAILLLTGAFILINPAYHGLIIALLLLASYRQIKNYMSGRIALFDDAIQVGNRLSVQNQTGIIAQTGRLGLKIRTGKGLQFINYSTLLADGYLLLSGEKIGGFYELKITPKGENATVPNADALLNKLTTVPYLNWDHKPDLRVNPEPPHQITTRVMVSEEPHLHDFFSLLNEWGFACKISKK